MKDKLKAIWKIMWSVQYVVISDLGMTASYVKEYPHKDIKLICDIYQEAIKKRKSEDSK